MSKRWLMVLSGLFAVSMFIGFNFVNVCAAEESSEEVSTEDWSLFKYYEDKINSLFPSSDAAFESESSDDEPIESESTSYSAEELESLTDKKKADKEKAEARSEALNESESESESASSSSGGSTVIVQEQDDSAVRTLINELIKGRDTLNGFQKQVLNRLDAISFCSIVIMAVTICIFFSRK
ncbi:unknown [Firmicutes bacterium CAG:882]|nr:unknown [Firmicutes bacterium CAG:882]